MLIKALFITIIVSSMLVLFGMVLPAMVSSKTDIGPIAAFMAMALTCSYGTLRLKKEFNKGESKDEKVS